MKPIRLIITLLFVALASAAFVGCSAEDTAEGASTGDAVDAGSVEDAPIAQDASTPEPDAEDVPVEDTSVSDTSVSDTTMVEDMVEPLDAEPGDAPQTAIVRWFEPESTGLGLDFVFKGGWAGEAGRVVTVGNDGLVASRDPDGDWEVLNLGSGADLLNDVDGSASSNLWAVGKKGALLTGSVEVLGEQKPCVEDAECASGDECSLGTCDAGTCVFEIVESPQCCGNQVVSWGFDDGTTQGFSPQNSMGGLEWHVVTARSSSPPNSLYFGDSKKSPPDFNTGEPVSGSVLSPPVTLPTVGSASVNFKVFMDAEASTSYDQLSVSVIVGGSAVEVWTKAEIPMIPTGGFVDAEADLSNWIGKTIQLQFHFDSIDNFINEGEGVYIDDLSIESSCEGATASDSGWPTLFGVEVVSETEAYAVGLNGTIIEYDGQAWREPQGPDTQTTWYGLHGDVDSLVMVGTGGSISVTEAGKLIIVESPTSADLFDVHSSDGQMWWAVGASGTLVKGTGASWSTVVSPTLSALNGVHAASPDNVYAVGAAGTVIHYNGEAWSLVEGVPSVLSTATFRSVSVDATGKATLVGDGGILAEGNATDGFVYAGALVDDGALSDIWQADGIRYIVGDNSEIFTHAGAWENMETPTTQHLRSISGVAVDDVWAVGWASVLLHWDGIAWEQFMPPMSGQIEAVFARATDDVYAVGSGGAILHWNGTQWSILVSETTATLRDIFVFPGGDKWAVGANATIMRHNGLAWHQTPLPPKVYADGSEELITDELHAIWGATPDDVWAVGANGRMVHWDGKKWNLIDSDFPVTLRGLYGLASDDMWAVGNEGVILHYDGETWTPWSSGSVATFYEIHGDGEGHVVIVGDIGTVMTLQSEEVELGDE
ncbi:MAG: hypothetical protein CL940_04055 [Deltaproteobacteria bacterium]|nr:hypothetical protein [Deltaproteobacteria bacterium]